MKHLEKEKTLKRLRFRAFNIGACDRIRTYDLLITNQLLYQLSYTGIWVGSHLME
jgi:hypothetical protein